MQKPDKVGIALLQALHMYNDMEITKVEHGGGFTIGKDTLTIRVNRMAFGLFEQSLLNIVKNREDLKEWSPELFGHRRCQECEGRGRFPLKPNTPEYDDAFADFNDAGDLQYGVDISVMHRECQGTGIVLKKQNDL